ncbi:MAG TPA: sigma 54-interacting transcriptional regulator [Acidimicrobiales bacterium]|nr:sigma 54-interacting transcriptional regulator [Acidimicrobiales bacterium]
MPELSDRSHETAAHDSAGPPGAATLGELKASGYRSEPVKREMRRNLLARIAAGRPVVDGVLGYDDDVLPALENAIIAGHDIIILGERGQAKSRIIRALVELLDEWLPVVEGSEINDDPFAPVSHYAREVVAAQGDDAPITWVHRSQRYGEKLATPDTSIADVIGELDPIKIAEGRYLSDEHTIHFGLVPRSNRGIFAVNELPDLAERIQVGLLDVLEERDIQIRGHKVRLPLDVMLVASANPEDYTNRGRIITPLKDRFGTRLRTHYPLDIETELTIIHQEAQPLDFRGVRVEVPPFMAEIVARVSQLARRSPRVSQRSGVSVRLSVANYETLAAASVRRAIRHGEHEAVPRVSDLDALWSSTLGKLEIESLEEGEDEEVVEKLFKAAILQTFRENCPTEQLGQVVGGFEDGKVVHAGPDLDSAAYLGVLDEIPALRSTAVALAGAESPGALASSIELVLEGLHLSKRLNKDASGPRATYRSRA